MGHQSDGFPIFAHAPCWERWKIQKGCRSLSDLVRGSKRGALPEKREPPGKFLWWNLMVYIFIPLEKRGCYVYVAQTKGRFMPFLTKIRGGTKWIYPRTPRVCYDETVPEGGGDVQSTMRCLPPMTETRKD